MSMAEKKRNMDEKCCSTWKTLCFYGTDKKNEKENQETFFLLKKKLSKEGCLLRALLLLSSSFQTEAEKKNSCYFHYTIEIENAVWMEIVRNVSWGSGPILHSIRCTQCQRLRKHCEWIGKGKKEKNRKANSGAKALATTSKAKIPSRCLKRKTFSMQKLFVVILLLNRMNVHF